MNNNTDIHEAVLESNLSLVRSLLQRDKSLVNSRNSLHYTPLHVIFCGDGLSKKNWLPMLGLLLDHGADVNARGEYVNAPLHVAVAKHQIHIVELLLKSGANTGVRDKFRCTALHHALASGNENLDGIVKLLLRYGADVNAIDGYGRSPLIYAARRNSLELVRILVEAGAEINYVPSNDEVELHTVLGIACENLNAELIEFLILKGAKMSKSEWKTRPNPGHALIKCADVKVKNKCIKMPLHLAVMKREVRVVELLLKSGIDANTQDELGATALHYAPAYGNENLDSIVNLLLEYGADVNAIDGYGRSALIYAVRKNKFELVRVLVEAGTLIVPSAQINHVPNNDEDDEYPALGIVCKKLNVKTIEFLIDKGAKANLPTRKSQLSPLHALTRDAEFLPQFFHDNFDPKTTYEHLDRAIKLLMEHGADLNARDRDGMTALDHALKKGDEKLVWYLLRSSGRRYDFKADENGNTMLHWVLKRSSQELLRSSQFARLLIQYGADFKAANTAGLTPFHLAVKSYNKEMVNFMLAEMTGVDEDALDCQWHFPDWLRDNEMFRIETYALDVAASLGYENVVDRLIEIDDHIQVYHEALYFAVKAEQFGIAKMLYEAGYQVRRESMFDVLTAIHEVIQKNPIRVGLICLLLEYVNLFDEDEFNCNLLTRVFEREDQMMCANEFTNLLVCYHAIDICSNGSSSRKVLGLIESNEFLKKCFRSCTRKLGELNERIVIDDITVFDIISKRLDCLVKFLEDKNNQDAVTLMMIGSSECFGIYEHIMKTRIDLAIEKRRLLDSAKKVLDNTFVRPQLPKDITWKILDYLNVRQLKIMTMEINEN